MAVDSNTQYAGVPEACNVELVVCDSPTEFYDPKESVDCALFKIGGEAAWHTFKAEALVVGSASANLVSNAGRGSAAETANELRDSLVPVGPGESPEQLSDEALGRDPAAVKASRGADVTALKILFAAAAQCSTGGAFLDAVIRDALSFGANHTPDDAALWGARELYHRLDAEPLVLKKVIHCVHSEHAAHPGLVPFDRLFIASCSNLFAKVMGTPWNKRVPDEIYDRLARVRGEMRAEGLLHDKDEIQWRREVLRGVVWDLRAECFMDRIARDEEAQRRGADELEG